MFNRYEDVRIFLDIDLYQQKFYYSDVDGPAYSSATSNGEVLDTNFIQYEGVIVNAGSIKNSVDPYSKKPSISNVSITIHNKDNLHTIGKPVALESGSATIRFCKGDAYDDVLAEFTGIIDDVSYDDSTLSFQIRSEETVLFKNVPSDLLEEDTFQTKLILKNVKIEESAGMTMRFGSLGEETGHADNLQRNYAKILRHPGFAGRSNNFWKGARIDVVDADGSLADPSSDYFAIGEFAVAVESSDDEIILPTVLDRYFIYTFIENVLRNPGSNQGTYSVGTLTAIAPGSITEGNSFVLNDGRTEVWFFFDKTGGGGYTPPVGPPLGYLINIKLAVTVADVSAAIELAINGVNDFNITATDNSPTINLSNDYPGPHGNNPIREYLIGGSSLNPTGMAGGGPNNPYNMHDVINNTMRNVCYGAGIEVVNGNFQDTSAWTIVGDWVITSGYAEKTTGAGVLSILYQDVKVTEGAEYVVNFTVSNYTSGSVQPRLGGRSPAQTSGGDQVLIKANGKYSTRIISGNDPSQTGLLYDARGILQFRASTDFVGRIDDVSIEIVNKPTFQILRNPIPENADSVGRPFPIVYGNVEKMWAVWAISAKSTRQNSLSAGDDVYVIAGHPIYDEHASDVLVYYGLDINAKGMNYKPGTIDFVPDPLPRSISEIDHWREPGFTLASGDPDKDVCPLHKLIQITTNQGKTVTAIKLRGDEYTGWTQDYQGNAIEDGGIPAVEKQPQFPIRYGLGNSKIYVSFRGYKDDTGVITGNSGSLIEHPVDILKHFLLNHTNIDGDLSKIDEDSFANVKARLPNWRFGVAITDIADGEKIVDRICSQCNISWQFINGKFKLIMFDLNNLNPTVYLDRNKDFTGKISFSRPQLSDVYNDFTVKYGYDSITNDYSRVITRNKNNDQNCRNNYSYYNVVLSHREIVLPDIFDSYTANQYIDHLVQLHTKQRLTLKTGLRSSEAVASLHPGVVASITFVDDSGTPYESIYLCVSISSSGSKIEGTFFQLDPSY